VPNPLDRHIKVYNLLPASFFTEVRGKQEYTLAVLLLEIALQKSLESITTQEASLGSTYDTLDCHLQLLHGKSEKV
jgi:hypothetical protein